MSKSDPSTSQWLPPHANAEPHRKMMEKLAAMTEQERNAFLFQISVQAGIYTPEGELTEHYRDEEDEEENEAIKSPLASPSQTGSAA